MGTRTRTSRCGVPGSWRLRRDGCPQGRDRGYSARPGGEYMLSRPGTCRSPLPPRCCRRCWRTAPGPSVRWPGGGGPGEEKTWARCTGSCRPPLARQVAAALDRLDDSSDSCLPAAAMPFLAHPSPRVRCVACTPWVGTPSPAMFPPGSPRCYRDSGKVVARRALRYLGAAIPYRLAYGRAGHGGHLTLAAHGAGHRQLRAPGTGSSGTWPLSTALTLISRQPGGRTCWSGCNTMRLPPTASRRRARPRRLPYCLPSSTLTGGQRKAVALDAGIRS